MAYNFGKTKAATANQYLNPGIYKLKVSEVTQDKFPKGSPYLGIKFENEEGLSFVEKFGFGTDKATEVALTRLQYIHEGFFGKPCEKEFKNLEEITSYFAKALTGGKKTIVKTIVVGGNESGTNVFASLPYAGFILSDEDAESAELGEFEVGSKEYKKVVKKNNQTSEVSDKKNGLLNDTDDDDDAAIGSKKKDTVKASTPKTSAKKPAVEKEEEEAEKEDDEMPW